MLFLSSLDNAHVLEGRPEDGVTEHLISVNLCDMERQAALDTMLLFANCLCQNAEDKKKWRGKVVMSKYPSVELIEGFL